MEDLKKLVERIDQKLDKVAEDVTGIKLVQVEQAADIKYHIRRTDLSEKRIEILHGELTPVKKHVEFVNTVFKIIGAFCTGLGVVFGAIKAAETIGLL